MRERVAKNLGAAEHERAIDLRRAREHDVEPFRQRLAAHLFRLPRLATHDDRVQLARLAGAGDAAKMRHVSFEARPRQTVILADAPIEVGRYDDVKAHARTI